MSKYFKGFLIGVFGLAVTFCLVVLVMGSIRGHNFIEEIKSWDNSEQQQEIPDKSEKIENQSVSQLQIDVEDNLIIIK